jgi:hypothetical protein
VTIAGTVRFRSNPGLSAKKLERAIRQMKTKLSWRFNQGWLGVSSMLPGTNPGNLPLLEFILKELREKRGGGVLLNKVYDAM